MADTLTAPLVTLYDSLLASTIAQAVIVRQVDAGAALRAAEQIEQAAADIAHELGNQTGPVPMLRLYAKALRGDDIRQVVLLH